VDADDAARSRRARRGRDRRALVPDIWGRGYATEAGVRCRDFVLEEVRRRVIALIDPDNESSIAVAERLGLSHARDVLQNGSKTMRLYALDAGGIPLRP
jgi:RimJ/RimL family protein N-acetyltransferase